MRKLLLTPEKTAVSELQDVLRWKAGLQRGGDELQDIRVPGSSSLQINGGVTSGTPTHIPAQFSDSDTSARPVSALRSQRPKTAKVNRRSTALGIRPISAPAQRINVNRASSLQSPQHRSSWGAQRQKTNLDKLSPSQLGQERYIPLNQTSTEGLPNSLRHIDVHALRQNVPQGHLGHSQRRMTPQHNTGPSPQESDRQVHQDRTAAGQPYTSQAASQESLADSGIVPTQDSPRHSHNGLSPATRRLPPVQEADTDPSAPYSQARGIPSLPLEDNQSVLASLLTLTRSNIEKVVNSGLAPEEKLDVMAAMCGTKASSLSPAVTIPHHIKTALRKLLPVPLQPEYASVPRATTSAHQPHLSYRTVGEAGYYSSSRTAGLSPEYHDDAQPAQSSFRSFHSDEILGASSPLHSDSRQTRHFHEPEMIPVFHGDSGAPFLRPNADAPILVPADQRFSSVRTHERAPVELSRDSTTTITTATDNVFTDTTPNGGAEETIPLSFSHLPDQSSRSYGIDIERWMSEQRDVGTDPHHESSELDELDGNYDDEHTKPHR